MRIAEAKKFEDSGFDEIANRIWQLHKTLPIENYFEMLEAFVDEARESLDNLQDPEARGELREHYRRVIEFAVDLACKSQPAVAN